MNEMAALQHNVGPITVSVAKRSGIWGVTVNGRFYGDYFEMRWAKQAALEKANLLHLDGKRARVEITDDKGRVIVITDEDRFLGLQ